MSEVDDETVSVVMPVHGGADAAHVSAAMESVLSQTRAPDEFVIVLDGPVGSAHERLVADVRRRHAQVLVRRLDVNGGAGLANQAGVEAAGGTWIAKVDADDINHGRRIEIQLEHARVSGADLVGSAMAEFDRDPDRPTRVRPAPLTPEAVRRRLRWNNPVNHPTAFFRRDVALNAGGYPPLRHMQDYVLVARMVASGAQVESVEDVLVSFRADEAMYGRRRRTGMLALEIEVQRELRSLGLTTRGQQGLNLLLRSAFRSAPPPLMRALHRSLLARRPSSE